MIILPRGERHQSEPKGAGVPSVSTASKLLTLDVMRQNPARFSMTAMGESWIVPRPTVHPGKFLAEELETLGVTPTELARQIAVPPNRISQIIHGKRIITGDTALRLAHWFEHKPEFWMELQSAYDIRQAQDESGEEIASLPTKRDLTLGPPSKSTTKGAV